MRTTSIRIATEGGKYFVQVVVQRPEEPARVQVSHGPYDNRKAALKARKELYGG